MWKEYELTVNSLTQKVRFNDVTVETLFEPFIEKLFAMQKEKCKRLVVFLVAPPAVGKSTLTLFLQDLAKRKSLGNLQALGLDGFHHTAQYLREHFFEEGGKKFPLEKIKGAPDTFDAELLGEKLRELTEKEQVSWPIYSRKIHDVVFDGETASGDVILLEGNWLLLKEARWANSRKFADYTVMIKADATILRERLISRKVVGGMAREAAEEFYEQSDGKNIDRVLKGSEVADETWRVAEDGDFVRED